MTEPLLEAADVVKVLGAGAGEVQALKGVSLALAPGELTMLMGPSGSGKTTLLCVLGCMLTPTRGTVRVRGRHLRWNGHGHGPCPWSASACIRARRGAWSCRCRTAP